MTNHGSPASSTRLELHRSLAAGLGALSDDRLGELVNAAPTLGSGIGGTTALLQVAGTPVFVKRLPLTDLERRPEHFRSTANLFDLPVSCHYGVGSPSVSAWRELAASTMASSWVLAGRAQSFPLLYHWRVLDRPASDAPLPDELADVERAVRFWHGSAAVRHRLEAIAQASATVTLFFEYLPQTLPEWLALQVAGPTGAAEAALAMVERSLRSDVAFMNAAGLYHFDAHLGNLLTDGDRLYFSDFGLATSPSFELARAESDFLATNLSHDPCHTLTRFVDWLVTALTGAPDWSARNQRICRVAAGDPLLGVMPAAAAIIERYAPIAVVINDFYQQLQLADRNTPYPRAEVLRACQQCGLGLGAAAG